MHNPEQRVWQIARKILFFLVLAVLIGLILFIFAIVIIHPKCEKLPQVQWWQNSIIYRIDLDKICLDTLSNGECFKSRFFLKTL